MLNKGPIARARGPQPNLSVDFALLGVFRFVLSVYSVPSPVVCCCSMTMIAKCAHETSETLEKRDSGVPGSSGTWDHHCKRRQRCGRHPDLFAGRSPIRIPTAVDHDPDHSGADRGP